MIVGTIRRIDFEPKKDFLSVRTYAHVFLEEKAGPLEEEVDVYTDDPRFEAALLAVYEPSAPKPPRVEVHWEDLDGVKRVVRVILDREFSKDPTTQPSAKA
jgi:hypothetical protein